MSIKTWKEEFYPIPANAEMSDMEALLHAKRKWEGLQTENLLKHHLHDQNGILFDIDTPLERFTVGAESCSLCLKHFLKWSVQDNKTSCGQCPIYLSRGEVSCDNLTKEEDKLSAYDKQMDTPWHMFTRTGNPEPMIEAINKAIEFLQNQTNE